MHRRSCDGRPAAGGRRTGTRKLALDTDSEWAQFEQVQGEAPAIWRELRKRAPEFFSAYADLAAVPYRRGSLSPKARELVMLAVNSAVTHLYRDGMRHHMRNALKHGATEVEILEVLQLVSVLGIHAISIGFPAAQQIAKDLGRTDEIPPAELTGEQADLKERFRRARGYWTPFWEEVLKLDTPLFEAYYQFSSVPWCHGVLEPKTREFIYIAIDASTTHMFDEGTRGHMANAFNHGATLSEILEVLELTTTLGIQSATVGLEILLEETAATEATQ